MNKFLTEVGKEVLGLEPDEMEKAVEFGDANGIWCDWSEADNAEIRSWYSAVLEAQNQ